MPDRRVALGFAGAALGAALARPLFAAAGGPAVRLVAGRHTQGGWARGLILPGFTAELDGAPVPVAPDGQFLIAFDRDAPPAARLTARRNGAEAASLAIAVAPRAWRIEHVDAPLRPPAVPDAEYQRLRAAELARIAAARRIVTAAAGWRQDMIRPAPGRISGRFGAQRIYRGQPGSYHSGLDFAAPTGTPILAPADGVVVLAAARPFTLEGLLLMVDHGMGLTSAFLHCSAHMVAEGEPVRRGQAIARVGRTGRATGPHLHWGLRWQTARLDPLLFLPDAG